MRSKLRKTMAVVPLLCLVACGSGRPGEIIRTPDERFENLPEFDFDPHYLEIEQLRIHYVDEGPGDAMPVLLLHGEPSWSFLYRKMIPVITEAGFRAIAPDLVGFGRSDKFVRMEDYSYQVQVDVMAEFVERLDLQGIVLFCQDWGGLVGLRVVAEDPERFAGVIAANTGLPLPTRETGVPLPFRIWRLFSRWTPVFSSGRIVDAGTESDLPEEVRAAYDAPFPTRRHLAALRRGEGSHPEAGKRRIWFKLHYLAGVFAFLEARHPERAIELFDAIVTGPTLAFIGNVIPPADRLSKELVLGPLWPEMIRRDTTSRRRW